MKLIVELVNNRSHRYLTFAMKTCNCLIIFKETSQIVMSYFQNTFSKKTQVRDLYKEKFKHLDMYSRYLSNLMNGNFVNFAVCSYYGDNTFLELAMTYFSSICSQNFDEIKQYPKVLRRCFAVMEVFFRYYLELVFEHFPQDIMCRIMEFLR